MGFPQSYSTLPTRFGKEPSIFILSALLYLVILCNAWAGATQTKNDPQLSEDEAYKIADDFAECAGSFYVFADIAQEYPELKNTTTNFRNIARAWEYGAAYLLNTSKAIKKFDNAVGYVFSPTILWYTL